MSLTYLILLLSCIQLLRRQYSGKQGQSCQAHQDLIGPERDVIDHRYRVSTEILTSIPALGMAARGPADPFMNVFA